MAEALFKKLSARLKLFIVHQFGATPNGKITVEKGAPDRLRSRD